MPLATRFGQDVRDGHLVLSVLDAAGCLAIPRPRSADADHALKSAREMGQAATLMYALSHYIVYPYSVAELRGSETRN